MNDSFLFYKTWQDVLLQHPADIRLEVLDAIISYATTGVVPQLSDVAAMAFSFIRNQIDSNEKRYNDVCQKRKLAIKRRWEKKNGKNTKDTNVSDVTDSKENNTKTYNTIQPHTNDTYNDNDNELYKNDKHSMNNNKELSSNEYNSQQQQQQQKENFDEEQIFNQMMGFWNYSVKEYDANLRFIRQVTDERKTLLRIILHKFGTEKYKLAVRNAMNSAYLNGRSKDHTKVAEFDWCMKEKNFIKILERNI